MILVLIWRHHNTVFCFVRNISAGSVGGLLVFGKHMQGQWFQKDLPNCLCFNSSSLTTPSKRKRRKKEKKKRKCYLENRTTWKDLAWLLPLINFKHNLTYSTDSQYATFFQCVPFIVSLMSWVIFMSSTDQKNVYWSGLLAKFKEVAKYLLFNVQPTFRNSLFP